jgi:hypothetical protein
MEHEAFVQRVLTRMPATPPREFRFQSWKHAGRPTEEGFGLCPVAGAEPERLLAAIWDVDRYVGNIEHVSISRSVPDDRYGLPDAIRFYQKVDIPLLGAVQQDLVLHRMGTHQGYEVAAWSLNKPATDKLSARDGFRSDYNMGAWFCAPGVVGYALSSAPKRGDVGFLKWKALTRGADAAAGRVIKANIQGMAAWARTR